MEGKRVGRKKCIREMMEDKLKGSYKHPRDWNYELKRNDELE